MEPAFRMHLRAHSTVAKFFKALKDAPSKAVSIESHLDLRNNRNLSVNDSVYRVLPYARRVSCLFSLKID